MDIEKIEKYKEQMKAMVKNRYKEKRRIYARKYNQRPEQLEYRRQYYQKNKEHIKALVKKNTDKEKKRLYVIEYSQRPGVRELINERTRNYYKNNKDKVREYKKKNKDKIREYQREYYLKHKKPSSKENEEIKTINESLTIRFD